MQNKHYEKIYIIVIYKLKINLYRDNKDKNNIIDEIS